ncbi:type II toxin-antitoxin system PemK/MazF family toxin [Pseudonocardia humida]|uniref:Type II toxin-antitoxin system PemK/MazF family toxin n=1 Tax=Pseudonocardia humida TaxID=2800819 RepID=A0ABT0ZYV7_9PSEU|nr:type II toxin-antitoxin system PemK/MazF family toxin [Pseudonocardia humida]MCO1655928.1 type II toxin-antitoxin system PemK/MazF family toxin [Pseudonocardia humida]
MADWGKALRQAARIGMDLLKYGQRRSAPAPTADPRRSGARQAPTADRADKIVYAPNPDGAADPGEVVWAWVPFEEGDGRGKDRPLLVVGRRGGELAALMLSSRHDRQGDRDWVSIGSGAWDRQGRESFARLDRVLEVGEQDIRREGAVLDRARFDRVADQLRTRFGWR